MKEADSIPLMTDMSISEPDVPPSTRIQGKIIKLDPSGWGFITSRAKPFTRIFFHWSALPRTINFTELRRNEKVEFELIDYQDKGLRAIRIEVLR